MPEPATPVNTPPGNDGAAQGGQPTYTADQYHGLRGAYEQQLKEAKAQLASLQAQHGQVTETAKLLTQQKDDAEKRAAAAATLTQQLAEAQTAATSQTKLNSRLQILMKYPGLLGPETMELVKTTTMEGEALDGALKGLAAKIVAPVISTAVVPPTSGGTPPQPPTVTATFKDTMAKADAALKDGNFAAWRESYNAALAMQFASSPFMPPIDSVEQPGIKPPAG